MKKALEQLGFSKCYHMIDFSQNQSHVDMVYAGFHGEKVVFTDKYQASVDFPSFLFYKEMMEAYPDAKVILTVREPEKWNEIVNETIYKLMQNEQHMICWFNNHTEEVKRAVPAEKLLVFSVKEGWEPLCKFLGADVPAPPFPKANDGQAIARKMQAPQEGGHVEYVQRADGLLEL